MSQLSETTSPKLLWGDMVDDEEFEREFGGHVNFAYSDRSKNTDEKAQTVDDNKLEREFGGCVNFAYSDGSENKDEKPQTPPLSYKKQSHKKEVQVSAPPPDDEREQIYYFTNQLHIMKKRLQKNSLLYSQERNKRATAEYHVNSYRQKIQEMETVLKNERQLRLASENELSHCKSIIADFQQSAKTSEVHSDEVKTLKRELQEQSSYIQELTAKLRAQEELTKSFERKVAEFADKVPQLVTVSKIDGVTQTDVTRKSSTPKDHVDPGRLSAQQEVSEPDEVPEVMGTSQTKLASKPEEVAQQETKQKRRRSKTKKEDKSPATNNQRNVIDKFAQPQEVIPTEDLLIPDMLAANTGVSDLPEIKETELDCKPDDITYYKDKKKRRRRKKTKEKEEISFNSNQSDIEKFPH